MQKRIIGSLFAVSALVTAGLVIGSQYEREEDEHAERGSGWSRSGFTMQDVVPVHDALYREECGSCHFAYQPGLLPAASWQKLMDDLANHFGENAELNAASVVQLRRYLVANAADQVSAGRSRGIANSLRGAAPLRITETVYFRRQHEEIPLSAVKDNPDVGSFSRCDACHMGAGEGIYNEHSVRIPGWGGQVD